MHTLLAASDASGWQNFLQYVQGGLTIGALFALIALGYTMVYGIIELINFAHGDLFMLGTFMAITVLSVMGINNSTAAGTGLGMTVFAVAAILIIVPVFCAALNVGVDRVVYRPLRNSPKLAPLVSAIGVSFVFMNLGLFWNAGIYEAGRPVPAASPRAFPDLISATNLFSDESGFRLTGKDVMVLGVTIPIMIGLTLFVKYTPLGKAMRATAQNPTAARLMGINVDRVIGATFMIGGALGGVASVVYSLYINTTSYQVGFQMGLYAFTAAVLGGIGNIPGAVLGGLVLGLVRSLGSAYVGETWTSALVFVVLILILVFRPSGLLGAHAGESMSPRKPIARGIPWTLAFIIVACAYPLIPGLDDQLMRLTGLPIGGRLPKLFIYAILALGLNVVVGYTGLLHLGIGAFFGIGAYITGILTVPAYPFNNSLGQFAFLVSLALATLGGALLSVVLSAPVLRLRGDYLALVTLGFGEVVRFALRNLQEITAGTKGLNPVPPPGFPFPSGWNWAGDYRFFYFLTLGILIIVFWLLWNLERSRLGRAWVAIREDELAATCMGVNSAKLKLLAFAIGAGLAGLAGCLYAHKQGGTADPDQYGFNTSILALLCLILGGIGNRKGVLLGVVLVVGFDEILSPIMDSYIQRSLGQAGPEYLRFSGWRLAVFGLALILVMRFRPSGLVPARRGV